MIMCDLVCNIYLRLTDIPWIIGFEAASLLIFLLFDRAKESRLRKELGIRTKKEFIAYKHSCELNYRDIFCMSEKWVINEYSYKVYNTYDIVNVVPARRSGNPRYKYGISIEYHGGTDIFYLSTLDERDSLLNNINRFLECLLHGTNFVQDNF